MTKSVSLRLSIIAAAVLMLISLALTYVSRTFVHFGQKTASACTLDQSTDSEVYFVSCGGFF